MRLHLSCFLGGENRSKYEHSMRTKKTTAIIPRHCCKETNGKTLPPFTSVLILPKHCSASICPFPAAKEESYDSQLQAKTSCYRRY